MTSCSIVITNYNYAQFVGEAIRSALSQTWPETDVVVVDDGSTDGSRQVIHDFGDQVVPVLKGNGGQASAFNAGAAASAGEVLVFLDADDRLAPNAVEEVIDVFADESVVKVHWPLQLIDADGNPLPGTKPGAELPCGDLGRKVLESGPTSTLSSPTSGNAWRRSWLERVLPVPEDVPYYRVCADEYLYTLAPVFGRIAAVPRILGWYRLHRANAYSSRTPRQKLAMELEGHEQQCTALVTTLARNGVVVDVDSWRRNSWFHRLQRAIEQIEAEVPPGETVVVADEDTWDTGGLLEDREVVAAASLTERGGPPADDAVARDLIPVMAHFDHLAFGWPSFWWFDTYPSLFQALGSTFDVTSDSDVVRILARSRR